MTMRPDTPKCHPVAYYYQSMNLDDCRAGRASVVYRVYPVEKTTDFLTVLKCPINLNGLQPFEGTKL